MIDDEKYLNTEIPENCTQQYDTGIEGLVGCVRPRNCDYAISKEGSNYCTAKSSYEMIKRLEGTGYRRNNND